MPDLTFPARIDPEQPNSVCDAFTVTFRDFPECLYFGAGHHTAAATAHEILAEAIAARIAKGEPIPKPSPPEPGEIEVRLDSSATAGSERKAPRP